MKKFFYVLMINLLCGISLSKAQTVTVSNSGAGQSSVYTFEYTTSVAIGKGTLTPNVFYLLLPTEFPAISPAVTGANNLDPYVSFKVNGVAYPCSTSFGVGGSWNSGVQLSVGGSTTGVAIPAGAKIKIVISGMIKNPTKAGAYTIEWRTAAGSGQSTQDFSSTINVSGGTLATQEVKIKQTELSVYPNPAVDVIQVSGVGKLQKYTVYNAVGSHIAEGNISDNGKINIHHFISGVYFLKLENGKYVQFIRK